MTISTRILDNHAATTPMRDAALHVSVGAAPVTATPAITAAAALVGAFAAGFAVGQASARG